MIGSRTRHSLAQFLELQEPAVSLVLLSNYGIQLLSLSPSQLPGEQVTGRMPEALTPRLVASESLSSWEDQ